MLILSSAQEEKGEVPKDSLDDLFPNEEEQSPGAEGQLVLGVGDRGLNKFLVFGTQRSPEIGIK